MPPSESPPTPPPLPHPWAPMALGMCAAFVALFGGAVLALQYMGSRPLDLRSATEELAQEIRVSLLTNRVPESNIRFVGALQTTDKAAVNYFEFDVSVPSTISAEGLRTLLRRQLMKKGVSALSTMGASGEPMLELSIAEQSFGMIRFRQSNAEGWRSWPEVEPDTESDSLEDSIENAPMVEEPGAEPSETTIEEIELPSGSSDVPPDLAPEPEASLESAPHPPADAAEPDVGDASPGSEAETQAADASSLVPDSGPASTPAVESGWSPPSKLSSLPDVAPGIPAAGSRLRAAIILDDGGYGGETTERILALDPGLTLSILPYTPFAVSTAERAHKLGFEVMLHMPMENADAELKHEGQLEVGMSPVRMGVLTELALDFVPWAVGINNHTGSKFTADAASMDSFFRGLGSTDLFFVDSRTVGISRAYDAARTAGIRAGYRDVFLDHEGDPESIREQFDVMVALAQKRGSAIAIGHFRPNTVDVLEEMLPSLAEAGIELVHASELVE